MRLLVILLLFSLTIQIWSYPTAVPLNSIKSLTLHKGQYATRNRSNQLQLQCKYTPDIVQCYNTGSDGINDNWKCES